MWNPFKHKHRWTGTGWNAYGMEIEQQCRCGAFRHHLASDLRGFEIAWREGIHPNPKGAIAINP